MTICPIVAPDPRKTTLDAATKTSRLAMSVCDVYAFRDWLSREAVSLSDLQGPELGGGGLTALSAFVGTGTSLFITDEQYRDTVCLMASVI